MLERLPRLVSAPLVTQLLLAEVRRRRGQFGALAMLPVRFILAEVRGQRGHLGSLLVALALHP